MIERTIEKDVVQAIRKGKVVLIYGARRVGKTILQQIIAEKYAGRVTTLNGESDYTKQLFALRTESNYKQILADTELLIIDEAQAVPEIGLVLKFIVDNVPGVAVLATGSSSFELQSQVGEPLVGRSTAFHLYPMSFGELSSAEGRIPLMMRKEEHLIYGNYPELLHLNSFAEKERYLTDLSSAYLMKDILSIDGIKNSGKMMSLLKLVALQMGSEVSYDELGRQLGLSRNTVEKYLDLLTKTFVLYRLPAYSRNARNEVSKAGKWYFCDNGIRNAIIGDFRPIGVRNDVGALWEAYLIGERIKRNENNNKKINYYFWRTYANAEIDLIEEHQGTLKAFEFKWGTKKPSVPSAFASAYPDAEYRVINQDNYLEFVLE